MSNLKPGMKVTIYLDAFFCSDGEEVGQAELLKYIRQGSDPEIEIWKLVFIDSETGQKQTIEDEEGEPHLHTYEIEVNNRYH